VPVAKKSSEQIQNLRSHLQRPTVEDGHLIKWVLACLVLSLNLIAEGKGYDLPPSVLPNAGISSIASLTAGYILTSDQIL
jgi:hypothetical protein